MITLAMSAAADPSVAGVTAGLFNTTQQIGAALGVAVLSTLAMTVAAGLLVAAIVVTVAFRPGSPPSRG